jgi:dGTPase
VDTGASSRYRRRSGRSKPDGDERTEGQRDRDRLIYSLALRRLGGVTQVVSPTERALIHNRLTHSLEVAQIGRGLVDTLLRDNKGKKRSEEAGGLDPWIVEAAALAHDLGHPPFGHVAENELNRLASNDGLRDGFEGNAQSFRIVTTLEVRHDAATGLDLTRATLCATLKYPWLRGAPGKNPNKWGAYDSEKSQLDWATELVAGPKVPRSLEAALMDWADDIAYAVHDMDDFFRAGLIPLDKLVTDDQERSRFLDAEVARRTRNGGAAPNRERMGDALSRVMDAASVSEPYSGTISDQVSLRRFTSRLINSYIDAVSFRDSGYGEEALVFDENLKDEVEVLKGLTWQYVIQSQALSSQRFEQHALIRRLYIDLRKAARNEEGWSVFPAFFQERLKADNSAVAQKRAAVDFITSMTEIQAVEMHQRLTGSALGSGIEHLPL